jgi:hypothetical protein
VGRRRPELLPGRKLARTAKTVRPAAVGSSAGAEDTARISTRVDPRIDSLPNSARNLIYAIVALSTFSRISVPIRVIAGMCDRRGKRDKGNAAGQIAGALRRGGRPYSASDIRKSLHKAHGCWIRWGRSTSDPWYWDRPNGDGTSTTIKYAHGDAAGGIYLPSWVYEALRFDPNVERLCKGLGQTLGRDNAAGRALRRLVRQANDSRLRAKRKGIPSYTEAIKWSRLQRESSGFEKMLRNSRKNERRKNPHHKEPVSEETVRKCTNGATRAARSSAVPFPPDWHGSHALWRSELASRIASAPAPGTPTVIDPDRSEVRRKAARKGLRSHRGQQRARKAAQADAVKRSTERSRKMTSREEIVAQKPYVRPQFILDRDELRKRGKPP